MRHFGLRNFNLRCGLRCRGRNRPCRQAIILVAEARAIQTANNPAHRIVKIVRGSQHIGHIQRRLCVLCGMRQTEYAPQNLLNINLARLIGKGREYVCKRTVPTLFERVYRDNIAHRAIGRKQIHVFQFVHIGCTNGDLLCGNTCLNQFLTELFKSSRVLFAFRLCLEQRNRTDIFLCFLIFRFCDFFQLVP